jgi:cytochrome c
LAKSSNTPMTSNAMKPFSCRDRLRPRAGLGNVAQRGLLMICSMLLYGCDRSETSKAVHPTEALAREKACLNCHAIDRKLVGPAFADVARRYAASATAQPELVDLLAKRIREGGSGAWGVVAMPASPNVSAEQSRELALWILAHGRP